MKQEKESPTYCRPLQIKLENVHTKKKIFINAPLVRDQRNEVHEPLFNSKLIFIVPDKTEIERELDLKLREEMKSKPMDFLQEKLK